jgi:hypothetical protein
MNLKYLEMVYEDFINEKVKILYSISYRILNRSLTMHASSIGLYQISLIKIEKLSKL